MGERGLPRTWRHMNGYGSHTYMWVNAAGEKFWVKYHFHTNQGMAFFTNAEAAAMAGADADFHRRDLFEAIARGEHPSWTLSVQVMPYAEARTYRINPFDLTKTWPHKDYPLIKVGTMTLNRNPENFFAQIEQAAFSPGNTVPGIGLSPDKMLLGRAFAYNDAQRNRIGTNFHQLPVNQPKVPVNTYMFDGQMAYHHSGNAPVYAPNSGGRPWADETGPVGGRLGGGWRDGPQRLHAACRGRRLRPAGHPGARGVRTTPSATSWSTRSPAACSAACASRCSNAPSTTGRTSMPRSGQRIEEKVRRGARRNRPKAWARVEPGSSTRNSPGLRMASLDALMLARIQFGFTISFHIIFPATHHRPGELPRVLEALWLRTKHAGLPRPLSLLVEGLRRQLRHGRRLGIGDGLPVRHQLERFLRFRRRPSPGRCWPTRC